MTGTWYLSYTSSTIYCLRSFLLAQNYEIIYYQAKKRQRKTVKRQGTRLNMTGTGTCHTPFVASDSFFCFLYAYEEKSGIKFV